MTKAYRADDHFFDLLARAGETGAQAAACVKAKLYSTLVDKAEHTAPLRSLTATRQAGYYLCIWERGAQSIPIKAIDHFNLCRICPSRLVSEHIDKAIVPWTHCLYAELHKK